MWYHCHYAFFKNWILCFFFDSDVAMLARASVRGDERALDKFSWKGAPLKMGPQEGLGFYIGTADGKSFCLTLYIISKLLILIIFDYPSYAYR